MYCGCECGWDVSVLVIRELGGVSSEQMKNSEYKICVNRYLTTLQSTYHVLSYSRQRLLVAVPSQGFVQSTMAP